MRKTAITTAVGIAAALLKTKSRDEKISVITSSLPHIPTAHAETIIADIEQIITIRLKQAKENGIEDNEMIEKLKEPTKEDIIAVLWCFSVTKKIHPSAVTLAIC